MTKMHPTPMQRAIPSGNSPFPFPTNTLWNRCCFKRDTPKGSQTADYLHRVLARSFGVQRSVQQQRV